MINTPASPANYIEHELEGAVNLRAMRVASNYNAFLSGEIKTFAQPHHVILEFGAGLGDAAGALQNEGYFVKCVEPSDSLRAGLIARDLQSCRSMDIVRPQSIDRIYSLNVLARFHDDIAVLARMHDALRPGGKAFIYVPAYMLLYSNMDRSVGHVRRYHRGELMQKVRDAGFNRIEKIQYVDSIGFFAAITYALISAPGKLTPSAVRVYDRWIFPVSRWIDKYTGKFIGKNLMIVMVRE